MEKMLKRLYLLLLILQIHACSLILHQKNNLFLKISHSELKTKVENLRDISLGPIVSKSVGFSNFAAPNFTENFKFNLIRNGYNVTVFTKQKKEEQKEITISNLPSGSSPNSSQTTSMTSLSPQNYFPGSTPVKIGKQDVQITDPAEISEICKNQNTQIFIGGFLYEGRTGPLLSEEVTSGIILSVYNSDGNLLTQIQYIGDLSMEEFENNSEVARLVTSKIKKLLK